MALALIGGHWGTDVLDIHAGGVDLIFPHHEDEIAQSCAFTGKEQFARYWLHGEFLNVRGTKMSKRFGNITTARDLREDDVAPGAVRLLMFQTHYRQKLDLTDEALAGAQEASRRLGEFQNRLLKNKAERDSPKFVTAAERLRQDMTEALDEDLNAPRAVAAVFAYMNEGHAAMDAGDRPGPAALSAWQNAEGVLGVASQPDVISVPTGELVLEGHAPTVVTTLSETPPANSSEELQKTWALQWALRRREAKTKRDYPEADRIRAILKKADWEVRDGKDGSIEVVRIKRAS
jgi:cysteinyl-tRNA synthetase